MIFDREFLFQVQPPTGNAEQQVPALLHGAEVSGQDMTYLHTFNGLLATPTDWGSLLACLLLSCSIESTVLD